MKSEKRPAPNTKRLTERFALHEKASEPTIIWDVDCKGFALRVLPSGVKSFIIDYRVDGRQRRMTIGRLGDWTVDGARSYARELKVRVDKGEDPYGKAVGHTVAGAWERYEQDRLPTLGSGTQKHYRRFAATLVDKFGKRRLDAITFTDMDKLHRSKKDAPYQANRLIEFARVLWNSAIKWQWATHNPTKGIDLNQEYAREDEYFTLAEIRKVLLALGKSAQEDAADLFVFLLATGCRPIEARSATWAQFDLENGIWTKKAASTKQRRIHRVPLNAMALRVLANRPRRDGPVFCYPDGRPIMRGEKVWRAAIREAGIRKRIPYAARHSFASVAAAQGLTLQVTGALLGHTQIATTQRYAHLFDEVLRRGTAAVGDSMKETV
jgi:integrase